MDHRYKRVRLDACLRDEEFTELENAFEYNIRTLYYKSKNTEGIVTFFQRIKEEINERLLKICENECPFKVNFLLECTYQKPNLDAFIDVSFKTKNVCVYNSSDVKVVVEDGIKKMLVEEDEFLVRGSGWSFSSIDGFLIRVNRFRPLTTGSYIPLPKHIQAKKAVVNPKNNDDYCFKWSILCRFIGGRNLERVNDRYKRLEGKYKFSMVRFPTPLGDVKRFSKVNGVSVNVYAIDSKQQVYPVLVSTAIRKEHFDLLLLEEGDRSHYCYIKNLEKLVIKQLTKHKHKIVMCRRCFTYYHTEKDGEKRMEVHRQYCKENFECRVDLPKRNEDGTPPTIKYKNYDRKYPLPIVAYADFESLLVPVETQPSTSKTSYTRATELHVPMSFCVYFVVNESVPDDIRDMLPMEPIVYRGKDAAKEFIQTLVTNIKPIYERLMNDKREMIFTPNDEETFLLAIECEMCKTRFTSKNQAVRDHCHITGCYRSALCSKCNLLRMRSRYFVPVFIHNLSNYDSNFIIRELGYDKRRIDIIPNTSEKYISFTKSVTNNMSIRFVDTFRFMSDSLDSLVKNMATDSFVHTPKFYGERDLPYVLQKGVYPYEYTSGWSVLEETSLPPKEKFYSKLMGKNVSDEDYQRACSTWDHFGVKTLGEYSDLYLKMDVLLLADVFESFRALCLKVYKIDCAYYLTAPGLAYDAMLLKTGVQLENLTDYDMYMFFEKSIRGGITSCVKKYAKANNPYVPDYDPDRENNYLMYIDANNLYGWAMSRCLPQKDFEWVPEERLPMLIDEIKELSEESSFGYTVEVDVEYPESLHQLHNDLPFLPLQNTPPGSMDTKLLTTLEKKTKYICHYINLKQAMEHGLKVTKVHRAVRYAQSKWLDTYIQLNTEYRVRSRNDSESEFFKLMNNSVFGKLMENIRKRIKIHLVSNEKRLMKLIRKPTFEDRIIYGENLAAVLMSFEHQLFDKCIYAGSAILDWSKVLMYQFHYDVMLPKYKGQHNVELLYMDTDSFFYNIKTKDVYEDLSDENFSCFFDLSNYPKSHPCFSLSNKKVLGKFKDECGGTALKEFVGLRAKMYAFKAVDDAVKKKAKGVKKSVVKDQIGFDDYIKCLNDPNHWDYRDMVMFQSKKHEVSTVVMNKRALCNYDDKRVSIDRVRTLAYGHFEMPSEMKSLISDMERKKTLKRKEGDEEEEEDA